MTPKLLRQYVNKARTARRLLVGHASKDDPILSASIDTPEDMAFVYQLIRLDRRLTKAVRRVGKRKAALPRDDGPIDLRRDVEITVRGTGGGAPCARPVDVPEADLPEVDEDEVDEPTTGRAA